VKRTVLTTLLALATLASPLSLAATPPNTLVVAQAIDDIISLDPAEGYELTSVQALNSLYQRLVQPDPAHPATLRPALASRWQPTADGRGLLFTLRHGARFASQNPLRPEDVVFSLSRAVKLNKAPAFILNELGWKADNVDSYLRKAGADQVEVRWPAKVGPAFALSILSSPVASIVDQKTALANAQGGDEGNTWLKTHSAGSGPFKIRSYQPHEALVLDANPTSPGGAPKLRAVILKNVADAASRRLLIEQGDADIARDLGVDQIASLQGKPGVRVQSIPSAAIDYLAFNIANNDNPALKNPALWQAARWLVDYQGVANKLLKGQFLVHQSFLPQGFPAALDDNPYKYDPTRARAILAKAGLKNVTIKVDVFNQPPFLNIAQSLQASFAAAGIRLELVPAVGSQVYAKVRARQQQAVFLSWTPDYFDPHTNASAFAINRDDGVKTLAWRSGWTIPALSDKTDAAVAEVNPARRARLYQEIQREVQRNSPFVVAFQAREQLVLRSNVKGYVQGLNADMVYFDKVVK
jgi:peptide/nickel transport system substrate-binding protein